MAFESKNLIQISAGEGSPDQIAGQKIFSYESVYIDNPTDTLSYMSDNANGFFNSLATKLRFGSYLALTFQGFGGIPTEHGLYMVLSDNPTDKTVVTLSTNIAEPVPSVYYETLGSAPVEFVTAGGVTDVIPFAASDVGAYASYSLNSEINDMAPPPAHSGIEYIECQAGQVLVKWSRPVLAGQTVKLWLQVHSSTPSP